MLGVVGTDILLLPESQTARQTGIPRWVRPYLADTAPDLRHSPRFRRGARGPSGWREGGGAGLRPTRAVST